MENSKSLFSLIASLLASTVVIKVLNFAKEIEISYFYGTSYIADRYNLVMIAPNISLNTIGPALGMILVSYYSLNKKKIIIRQNEVIFLGIILIFLLGLSVVTQPLDRGANIWSVVLSYLISLLFLVQVLLVYYFHCFRRFDIGSKSSIIQIVLSIILILLSYWYMSYIILVLALLISLLAQIVYLISKIIHHNLFIVFQLRKGFSFDFYHSFFSIVLGYGLIEILISIQKIFANYFEYEGLISAINYAYKIMNLPISIFLFAVLSVMFPEITKLRGKDKINKMYEDLVSGIFLIMFPCAIVFFYYSSFITSFLFERGNFDEQSIFLTSFQLKYFAFLLPMLAVYSAQLRILYVLKVWRRIYLSALMIISLTVIFNLVSLKIQSLALYSLSLSVAYFFSIFIFLDKNLRTIYKKALSISFISSIPMVLILYFAEKFAESNLIHIFLLAISLTIYLVIQYFLGNKALKILMKKVLK
ncbi:lipid II flippase MurJ [Domibacillus indicus]|uniref:lipid II flippase MurJ n=1 Tax=Domibacillus indicus TaxID=1437523 RepID=UPI000618323A|nr:lipid II flippase MurJ [Domibacillus indicus]